MNDVLSVCMGALRVDDAIRHLLRARELVDIRSLPIPVGRYTYELAAVRGALEDAIGEAVDLYDLIEGALS